MSAFQLFRIRDDAHEAIFDHKPVLVMVCMNKPSGLTQNDNREHIRLPR